MRIIEKCWIDLYEGYRTVQALETRLVTEWGRAIQVTQRRRDRVTTASRTRKQRITALTVLTFLVVCTALQAGFYYLPERRPEFLMFFCMLATAGSLIVAAYMFRRGSETVRKDTAPSMGLMASWWKALRPRRYPVRTRGDRAEVEFLKSLAFLDDRHIAVWGLLTSARVTSDTDVLLLGPGGIWVFEVKYWSGKISKQDGAWYTARRLGGRKVRAKSPDQQWLDQKEEIAKTIRMRLPEKAGLADLIKGGVVFSHEGAELGGISGHKAAYGKPASWHKRIQETAPVPGFDVEDQLQLLDALIRYANQHEKERLEIRSAREQADQLYEDTAAVLRKYVSERL
jgi:hypothetical protein